MKNEKELTETKRLLEREAERSAIMQDALECIMELGDGEGGSPAEIAQETLEAIAIKEGNA